MMRNFVLIILPLLLIVFACQPADNDALTTVASVDQKSFTGEWYEIASLEPASDRDCTCQRYTYFMMQDGGYRLLNRCQQKNGEWQTEKGKAWPIDGSNNAKWTVEYQWPFKGKMYILALSPDYSYALVGNPDLRTLRVLARKKTLPESIMEQLAAKAKSLGYPVEKLELTDQSCKN